MGEKEKMKILVFNKDLPPMRAIRKDEKNLDLGGNLPGTDLVIWSWEKQDFLNQLNTYDFDLIIQGGELILPQDAQKLINPS
jgi:hypothetical protein